MSKTIFGMAGVLVAACSSLAQAQVCCDSGNVMLERPSAMMEFESAPVFYGNAIYGDSFVEESWDSPQVFYGETIISPAVYEAPAIVEQPMFYEAGCCGCSCNGGFYSYSTMTQSGIEQTPMLLVQTEPRLFESSVGDIEIEEELAATGGILYASPNEGSVEPVIEDEVTAVDDAINEENVVDGVVEEEETFTSSEDENLDGETDIEEVTSDIDEIDLIDESEGSDEVNEDE